MVATASSNANNTVLLHWRSEDDTRTFAQQLAALWLGPPGGPQCADFSALITLEGDLGAGKTTFSRHLLQALGVQGRIKSPTYAIVEPYMVRPEGWTAPLPIHHFDFYRLGDPLEFEEAGLRDLVLGPGLKLAEWPERVAEQLPSADWALTLRLADDESRSVLIAPGTPLGRAWLDRFRRP